MMPAAKILIVEHSSDDIELIEHELTSADIKFVSEIVKDEQGYINAIKDFIPDIILSDYSLPSFDGDSALKVRTEIAAETPFIFVSGSIGEEKSIEYIKNGVTDYVLKDKLFTLGVKVKRALQESKDRIHKRQIESDLKQSENRFRALIEKSNEMVTLSGEDGKIFYISPSVKKTFGYSFEDVSKASSFSFIHPDDLKEFEANRNEILTIPDISYHCQLRLLHKKGYWIWCESTLTNMLHEPGVNALVSNFRDISERKSAEKQQDFDRHNLDALINNTNDLMWSVDRNFRLITSNKPFDDMGKITFGEPIERGCSVLSIAYPPDILSRFKQLYERAFTGEAFTETEYFAIPVESWTEISYYPIRRGNEIIGTACHSRDITERKKAEEALKKSERELQITHDHLFFHLENSPLAFIEWDNRLKPRSWSTRAAEIFGWNEKEVMSEGFNWLSKIYEEDITAVKKKAQQLLKGKFDKSHVQQRNYTKDGRVIWCEWYNSVLKDKGGKVITIMSLVQDITERKKAEQNLQQSEKRYRQIVETAQEGIWMIDENNITTFVNKKMCHILGYSQEEMIGRTNFSFKDKEEQKKALQQIERRRTGLTERHDATFITKDGREIWVHVSTNPVFDEAGKYCGALAMMTDITERKEAEIQMKNLNDSLEKQTSKLAVSNDELERFAYVTSHDLQEPLRMVSSFLELLQKKYDQQLDQTAQKYINFAVEGAARMKILILDLLEFSRISSVVEDHKAINLNNIVTKTRHALKVSIDTTLTIIHVGFLPMVCGNESQLLQLFQNLIGNAIKYKDGSNPVIDITHTETAAEWQFCIADNGIGIDAKFYEKIFIIFQRLHNKHEFAGTGIGLAICKKIVEQHGGKIWVESIKDEGSRFYFTISKQQRSEANISQALCQDIPNP